MSGYLGRVVEVTVLRVMGRKFDASSKRDWSCRDSKCCGECGARIFGVQASPLRPLFESRHQFDIHHVLRIKEIFFPGLVYGEKQRVSQWRSKGQCWQNNSSEDEGGDTAVCTPCNNTMAFSKNEPRSRPLNNCTIFNTPQVAMVSNAFGVSSTSRSPCIASCSTIMSREISHRHLDREKTYFHSPRNDSTGIRRRDAPSNSKQSRLAHHETPSLTYRIRSKSIHNILPPSTATR